MKMTDEPNFQIKVGKLKTRQKDAQPKTIEKVDRAGEAHGFVDREPRKKRGRPASPRTGQVHAKVMPNVSREIADEAKIRGVQQGVLIEEAWELYKTHK
jgi:hypothetical protein